MVALIEGEVMPAFSLSLRLMRLRLLGLLLVELWFEGLGLVGCGLVGFATRREAFFALGLLILATASSLRFSLTKPESVFSKADAAAL
jgi:hypothetical protein